jgi:hypothetical protein
VIAVLLLLISIYAAPGIVAAQDADSLLRTVEVDYGDSLTAAENDSGYLMIEDSLQVQAARQDFVMQFAAPILVAATAGGLLLLLFTQRGR